MGSKGKWFSNVKKAFSSKSKQKKSLKSENGVPLENVVPSLPPPLEEVTSVEATTNEQNEHDVDVSDATMATAEPALTSVETTVEVVRSTSVNNFVGKMSEEVAAIKIQTAFRGYMARRALRALRGLVRLKSLMEGSTVKRQAVNTLRCMQTLSRVQSQIHSRRVRMSEEKQALQRQLLQKHAKELENFRIEEEWDDSIQSKEQIEAKLLNKYEAAMRRERALAYAFTHQQTWKNSSRYPNPMFLTLGNPTWGWSWLERWMAANPWDAKSTTEKELYNDQSSVKSASHSNGMGGEISKSYARYQLNLDKLSSPKESEKPSQTTSPRSPLTPSKPVSSALAGKLKSASPKSSTGAVEDDAKSMVSMQSERRRRHSIGGSSVPDDESQGSSQAVPSYMVPTESARAKSRLSSSSGTEKNGTPEKEKGPVASTKKRLSFPPSPTQARRHSGPPKVEMAENTVPNVEVVN